MNRIILLFIDDTALRQAFGQLRLSCHGWEIRESGMTFSNGGTTIYLRCRDDVKQCAGIDASMIVEVNGLWRPAAEWLSRVRQPIDT